MKPCLIVGNAKENIGARIRSANERHEVRHAQGKQKLQDDRTSLREDTSSPLPFMRQQGTYSKYRYQIHGHLSFVIFMVLPLQGIQR
jgi:hypothetical protein